MIDVTTKIHDKLSIEFKMGFISGSKIKENKFAVNTWIFIPNSLDINPLTYSKSQFYRDIKSNIRLITPVFSLEEIAGGSAIPFKNLKKSFKEVASDTNHNNIANVEYQSKMFSAIFKSAMRNEVLRIRSNMVEADLKVLIDSYLKNVLLIFSKYRNLNEIIDVPTISVDVKNNYFFVEEFICSNIERSTYMLIDYLDKKNTNRYNKQIQKLADLIRKELQYKKDRGYSVVEKDNSVHNRELIFRGGVLKKYIESDLFLMTRKKKDGVIVEQIYYSIAAGLSMIFATAVAFSVQQTYGSFTMPLFVALVVSYMLKDRIKELMRFYFVHRLGSKYFDNKTSIFIKDKHIGTNKEGVDFIIEKNVPTEVMTIRSRSPLMEAENRMMDEKILLYRRILNINSDVINKNSDYHISGVNDIVRLHFTHFVQKMDDAQKELHMLTADNSVLTIKGEKAYYINIIMQLQYNDNTSYKRFRVIINHSGISGLEELR